MRVQMMSASRQHKTQTTAHRPGGPTGSSPAHQGRVIDRALGREGPEDRHDVRAGMPALRAFNQNSVRLFPGLTARAIARRPSGPVACRGLTLVELLVVIVILTMVTAAT